MSLELLIDQYQGLLAIGKEVFQPDPFDRPPPCGKSVLDNIIFNDDLLLLSRK
jgi:hypothetical protein